MEPLEIDYETAKFELELLAKEYPDHVYMIPETAEGCVYFEGEHPSCIVGHVLHNLGVTAEDIGEYNWDTAVDGLSEAGFLNTDRQAFKLLATAQQQQDCGVAWGPAVGNALKAVEGETDG